MSFAAHKKVQRLSSFLFVLDVDLCFITSYSYLHLVELAFYFVLLLPENVDRNIVNAVILPPRCDFFVI